MKLFGKKGCDCTVTRNDVLMAVGAAIFAVLKAVSAASKHRKQAHTEMYADRDAITTEHELRHSHREGVK